MRASKPCVVDLFVQSSLFEIVGANFRNWMKGILLSGVTDCSFIDLYLHQGAGKFLNVLLHGNTFISIKK